MPSVIGAAHRFGAAAARLWGWEDPRARVNQGGTARADAPVPVGMRAFLFSGCWVLGAGCWLLDAGCWLLGAGCWLLDAGCWMLDAGCSLLGAGWWVLVAGCWMLGRRWAIS